MASSLLAQGTDAVDPTVSQEKVPTKTYDNTGTVNAQVRVKTNREYNIPSGESVTTTTTSTGNGFPDLIPTILPALQSSSYVLVILAAFVAWSSRKLFTDFLERHIELMGQVKSSLEAEKDANDKQLAILTQLTENNRVLASTVDRAVGNNVPMNNRPQ